MKKKIKKPFGELLIHFIYVTRRIVILGKTGAGKSSLSNTLLGETAFAVSHSPKSGTITCEAKTTPVCGKSITLIDTPGLFDTERPEEEMKAEILKCLVECAPGPHAFIIVLRVEKYTKQEKEIIEKITEYFEDDALKFATVVFTHGDQLPEGEKIEEFVSQSKDLSHLVEKCGNRCHVIDNKYWKKSQDEYRNNQFQVKELLNTLDKITEANHGGYYTNEVLEALLREIEKEKESIQLSSPNLSPDEVTEEAKSSVFGNLMSKASELSLSVMLTALFGGAMALVSKQDVGRSTALFLTLAFDLATGAAAALVRSTSGPDEANADETRAEEAGPEEEDAEKQQEPKSADQTTED